MSSTDIVQKLVRKDIRQMSAYQSASREQTISSGCWLNANEAGGNESLTVLLEHLNRYPDFQPQQVVENYARYAGVKPANVLVSRGADEGIELLIRSFCQAQHDSILICPPTYGMYRVSATAQGVNTISVPLTQEYQLDVESISTYKGQCKVIFVCAPNNPTGTKIKQQDIFTLLEVFKEDALVVVDEAYIEFCSAQTMAPFIAQHPNLVILRTLSKAFALAGLRCGFTLAHNNVLAMMKKIIAPYPLSQPVATLAANALTPANIAIMHTRVTDILARKQRTLALLKNQPWIEHILPSATNFVLFKTKKAKSLFDFLNRKGILIRNQSSQPTLDNCLRVSIGNEDEMKKFYCAVEEFNQVNLNQVSLLGSNKQ
ncbi:histidinol-phosphate transaminase [Thalassotalea aquiviva]|uniref:histidinol-phosphate transaminase n=1 Tax=Thalassotalea aquiviva TaxID=3242415 RepID=UPI00352AFB16